MSLATFKRKAEHKYGSRRTTAQSPPIKGKWVARAFSVAETTPSPVSIDGFSINGGLRTRTNYAGYRIGKVHTPYKGEHAIGFGGRGGEYNTKPVVWAVGSATIEINASQSQHIKPSSLSSYGRLQNRYRNLYSGQYPNRWVQTEYSGNLTDNASSSSHIERIAAKNMCAIEGASYTDHPRLTAQSAGDHILARHRACLAQTPEQEHFPHAVSGTGASTNSYNSNPFTLLAAILANLAAFWSTNPDDPTTLELAGTEEDSVVFEMLWVDSGLTFFHI